MRRLQSERAYFEMLGTALMQAEDCPGSVFDDLNFRAHRLKGVAATFGFTGLVKTAGALERASFAAATAQARNDDLGVEAALNELTTMLDALNDPIL